jgi:predicted nucleotidyltransferase
MKSLWGKSLSLEETQALVQKKINWILEAAPFFECYVFGSASKGEMTNASDVDLLLVYPSAEEVQNARRQIFQKRPKDDWPHDLIFVTKEEFCRKRNKVGSICHEVSSHGILFAFETGGKK